MSAISSVFDEIVSAPQKHEHILVDTNKDGITLVQLAAPPVNLFTIDFFTALNDWLTWLYHDLATRAVLITSAVPNIFTGGFDIKDFMDKTLEQYEVFWRQTQRHWLIMNGFSKPIAVVITGTCPGIGCVLAVACDHRVMVRGPCTESGELVENGKPFRIGLNECSFGLYVPPYVQQMYSNLLGYRTAELLSIRGTMLSAEEAVQTGLVDAVAENKAAAIAMACDELLTTLKSPAVSFRKQRSILRRQYMELLLTPEDRQRDVEEFYEVVSAEPLQQALSSFLEGLRSRKK